jgi:hypothetical protein
MGHCHTEVRITVGKATRLVGETLKATCFERNLKTYEIDLIELADATCPPRPLPERWPAAPARRSRGSWRLLAAQRDHDAVDGSWAW